MRTEQRLRRRLTTTRPSTGEMNHLEPWVQLATRIPKTLHRELKLYCVNAEIPVMVFVVDALAEKLRRDEGGPRRGPAPAPR
jgi:hypothetical protein